MPKICLLKLRTRFKIPTKDGRCLGILGSHEITGAWDESRPIFATEIGEGSWEASFRMISGTQLEWKWVVYDKHRNKVLQWEVRDNRTLVVPDTCSLISTQFDGEQYEIISQKEGLVESTKSVETASFSSPEESDQRGTPTSNESIDAVHEVPPSSRMLAESENGNQLLLNSYVNAAEDKNRIDLRETIIKESEFVSLTSYELGEKDKDVEATPEIHFEKIAAAVNGRKKESMSNTSHGKEQAPTILEMHQMKDKKIPSALEISVGKESNVEASDNKHIPITPNVSVEKRKTNQSAPVVAKKNEQSVLLRDTQVEAALKIYPGRETRVSPTCELSHETDQQFKLPVSEKNYVSNQSAPLVLYSNKATEITSELAEGAPSVTGASNGSGDSILGGSKENSNKMEIFSADIHSRNTKYVLACASTATQTSPKALEDNISSANSTQTSPSVNKEDIDKKGAKSEPQSGHLPYHWSSLLLVPAAILATAALTYIICRKSR